MRINRLSLSPSPFTFALIACVGSVAFLLVSRSDGAVGLRFGPAGSAPAVEEPPAIDNTEQLIWSLQEHIRNAPRDVDAYAYLGDAYLQRARETGDPTYYSKAQGVLDTASKAASPAKTPAS